MQLLRIYERIPEEKRIHADVRVRIRIRARVSSGSCDADIHLCRRNHRSVACQRGRKGIVNVTFITFHTPDE